MVTSGPKGAQPPALQTFAKGVAASDTALAASTEAGKGMRGRGQDAVAAFERSQTEVETRLRNAASGLDARLERWRGRLSIMQRGFAAVAASIHYIHGELRALGLKAKLQALAALWIAIRIVGAAAFIGVCAGVVYLIHLSRGW